MKISCSIVRDLITLYTDDVLSNQSKLAVQKHLKNCEECRKYYNAVKFQMSEEKKRRRDETRVPSPYMNYNAIAKRLKKRRNLSYLAFAAVCGFALGYHIYQYSNER